MACLLLAFFTAAAAGQIYRWVDEEGVVHFGQIVPQGVEAEAVGVRPNTVQIDRGTAKKGEPAAADAATAGAEPELSAAERSRQERAERRQQAQQQAERVAAQCAQMRRQKAFLEPSPRVLVQDEDGTVRRLEDAEREKGLAEANAFLAANCDG